MNTNLYKSTETSITKNGVEMTLAEAASELQELSRVSYRLECDKINLTATAKQLNYQAYERRARSEQLTTLFSELPDINFDEAKRLFADELAEHDAEVIEESFKKLATEYAQHGLRNTFSGFDVAQHIEAQSKLYANQLHQKTQDESK